MWSVVRRIKVQENKSVISFDIRVSQVLKHCVQVFCKNFEWMNKFELLSISTFLPLSALHVIFSVIPAKFWEEKSSRAND